MCAESGVLPRPEGHTVARIRAPGLSREGRHLLAPHVRGFDAKRFRVPYRDGTRWQALLSRSKAFPDVEIIWKSCGMRRLTGFYAARYVCKVSRTVGFALVRVRLD
jgi:hypothetical protein